MRNGSGSFQHGFTYLGHALACSAALAVQKVIQRDNLVAKAKSSGVYLKQALHEAFGDHPYVGDIRGRGLLWGLELVENRDTKKPFDPTRSLHARVKKEAMARGLACYPSGGTIDGEFGDHVLLAPPFITTESELSEIVARLREALNAAIDTCLSV
jgi:adenosylmethionine-8-amino-7-oxononanoate aminotransferase